MRSVVMPAVRNRSNPMGTETVMVRTRPCIAIPSAFALSFIPMFLAMADATPIPSPLPIPMRTQ